MLVTGQMADGVPFEVKQSRLWRVVVASRACRSAENSSVPWCSSRPWEAHWALPEIFCPAMAMSQLRLRTAGTPMALSASMTGRRQRS